MISVHQLLTALFAVLLPLIAASPAPPSFLPDFIKRAATDIGVDFSDYVDSGNNEGFGNQTINFYPPEYKEALQNGDYDTIARLDNMAAADQNPVIAKINAQGENAWTEVPDEKTGTSFYLAYAGPATKPDAFMWTFVVPTSQANGNGTNDYSTTNVMQVGTMSGNAKFLGITLHTYSTAKKVGEWTFGLSLAKKAITSFIQKRIAGIAVAQAISAAAEGAAIDVATGAAVVGETALLTSIASGLLIVGIVVVVTYLVLYIYDFIRKEYKGSATVYNWSDSEDYELIGEYGYNEAVADGLAFKKAFLGAVASSVFLPSGFAVPSTPQVSYANYNYVNNVRFAVGFGVALEVRNLKNSTDGFRFKYFINPYLDNLIGIAPLNPEISIKDYYDDDNEWSPRGDYEKQITIGENTPVLAHTPKLGGSSNDLYPFDIHIGIQRGGALNQPSMRNLSIAAPPAPQIPAAVRNGEEITLPDGSVVTATVSAQPSASTIAHPSLVLPQVLQTLSAAVA